MPADAVLFDMDGVLVDSERYWVRREREAILPATVDGEAPEIAEITGLNYRDIYEHVAAEYDVAVDRERFLDLYEEAAAEVYGQQVRLLPGLRDLLSALADAGVPAAVVSSSPQDWIDRVVERFDLGDAFAAVVSAEDLDGPGKPEPGIYEHAAARVGADPAACVAVEDSEHGVAAAAAAGAFVVGYRSESDDRADLSAADAVAATPADLRAAIRERALR
jgi:HAD superfamily hydrolase (TIGR01509 family)